MGRIKLSAIAGLIGGILAGTALSVAEAGSLRCSGRLVDVGDYPYEVLHKCGPPTRTHAWEEDHGVHFRYYDDLYDHRCAAPCSGRGPTHYERWIYDLGVRRFVRRLLFENGVLIKIELGDRGAGGGGLREPAP